jgi:hypothetical protein
VSFDPGSFVFERDFNREELVALVEKVRKMLDDEGIGTNVWMLQPWRFSLSFNTGRSNINDLLYKIYGIREVLGINLAFEGSGKIPLIEVLLKEDWFRKDDEKNATRPKRHPEDEGGPLS